MNYFFSALNRADDIFCSLRFSLDDIASGLIHCLQSTDCVCQGAVQDGQQT